MRIAQVATLATPVRRDDSGSIETMVWLLTRELVALGHEVTVFAAPGSEVAGRLVSPLPGTYATDGAPEEWFYCEWANLCAAVAAADQFDVIHSHAYLWGLPLGPLSPTPLVHTLHTRVDDGQVAMRRLQPDAIITGISDYQWSDWPGWPPIAVVRHGIDMPGIEMALPPTEVPAEPYLLWLGRFLPDKGALEAIEVSRRLGLSLRLAGPANAWFDEVVRPQVDGKRVRYEGWVTGDHKHRLLAGAAALVYPVSTLEPFGLVLAEAIVRGTPVAAYAVGAVPELLEDGVTGCAVEDPAALSEAVTSCLRLDRRAVAARGRERFSAARMAREYAKVFAGVGR